MDFFPVSVPLFPSAQCQVGGSSTFVQIWLDSGKVLCFSLDDHEKRRLVQRSIDQLEKTKYSLVANSSNYGNGTDATKAIRPQQPPFLDLVSSANKLAVRFFAKQGRFPGRGLKAKFKIGMFFFENRCSNPREF